MAHPDSALMVAVANRILTELEMMPFTPIKLMPDGRLRLDEERLAGWLAAPVVELLEKERKSA